MIKTLFISLISSSILFIPEKKLETGIYYVKRQQENSTISVYDELYQTTLYIDTVAICKKEDFKEATVDTPEYTRNHPVLNVVLTEKGKERFAEATQKSIGSRLAIFIEGEFIFAPMVYEEIKDGKFQISGGFSMEKITQLKNKLIENPETN